MKRRKNSSLINAFSVNAVVERIILSSLQKQTTLLTDLPINRQNDYIDSAD